MNDAAQNNAEALLGRIYQLILGPETSIWGKALLAGALLYLVMPFDAIPDVLLGVGQLDDALVLLVAAAGLVISRRRRLSGDVAAETGG